MFSRSYLAVFVTCLCFVIATGTVAFADINFGPPTGQPAGGGRFGYPTGQTSHGGRFGHPAGSQEQVAVQGSSGYFVISSNGSLTNTTSGEVFTPVYQHGKLIGYNGNRGNRFVLGSDGVYRSNSGASFSQPVRSGYALPTRRQIQEIDTCVLASHSGVPIRVQRTVIGSLDASKSYKIRFMNEKWRWLVDSNFEDLGGWVDSRFLHVINCSF